MVEHTKTFTYSVPLVRRLAESFTHKSQYKWIGQDVLDQLIIAMHIHSASVSSYINRSHNYSTVFTFCECDNLNYLDKTSKTIVLILAWTLSKLHNSDLTNA